MGISKSAFRLLLEEAKRRDFRGKKVLQLGRQHTFLTFEMAHSVAQEAGVPLEQTDNAQLSFNEDLKEKGYIDDITLFSLLGFEQVDSLDVSTYENASLIHDLNLPLPQEITQHYDLIFDGGTLEHVFHLPQVFSNIHNLLARDGIIIHASPSHNHVDHGFYMFSPTLFSDYYTTNAYRILSSYIFEYSGPDNRDWEVFEYVPGCLDALSFGGFGEKLLAIWFVAQKQPASTGGVIPQQGAYIKQWANSQGPSVIKHERPRKIRDLSYLLGKIRKKVKRKASSAATLKAAGLKKIGSF